MHKNKYLAAVSGGPDSIALLNKYHKKIYGVCHINYHYRDTSDFDQSIVKQYCDRYKIKSFILNIDKKIYSTNRIKNFENWARIKRYDFFLKIANKTGIKQILMGHNADDFVETYYMQKQKGTQLLFYGIKKENYYKDLRIYRPFIKIRKTELEKYCNKHHIEYAIDITNSDPKFLRNKFRKIISKMNNKQFYKVYNDICKINKSKNKLLKKTNKLYCEWTKQNYDLIFFKNQENKIQIHLIYKFLINFSPWRISMNKINEIIRFFLSNKGNTYYRLNQKLKIYKKQNKIKFV